MSLLFTHVVIETTKSMKTRAVIKLVQGGLVEISTGEYIINALNNDYDTIVRCVKSYTPSSDSDDEDEEEDIEDDDEHVKIWSSIIEDYKLRIFELTEEDIDDDDVALFRKNFITNPQKSKYRYESHMDFYYVDKLLNLFRSRLSEEEFFIAKANITGEYLARWADGSSEWLSEKIRDKRFE